MSFDEGKALADDLGMSYYETSAKTGFNIEEAFDGVTRSILKELSIEGKSKCERNKERRLRLGEEEDDGDDDKKKFRRKLKESCCQN